ncbi:MAG: c-type cytochrome [Deltaproteobacteria bacterium]|nr:c-type cytochrome [Deltaproteobacteria bacterium]MBT7154991.1 c-type cytochrome [Deltaproteobacteria bacterium]
MSRLSEFISDRIGWEKYLQPFLYKKLPSSVGWSAALGSLCALTFVVMAVTGMFLAMYYVPSPDQAYESINYIMNDVSMGAVLRGIHHWGAGAMVVLVFLHMGHIFFTGSFKAPRELTWIVGVILFLVTLGLGFTGYLLPWDQKAYWATVVSANIARDIPVIGEFITRMLLGGSEVSGLTLTRFFSIHMLILPGLLITCVAVHIYLVRIHGNAEHAVSFSSGKRATSTDPVKLNRFYPEHLSRASIAFFIVFGIIMALAVFGHVPLEGKVGTADPTYAPRPEWYFMWLFQMLTYFSGSSEIIGSLLIPSLGILLLFLMPWLGNRKLKAAPDRPLAVAAGATVVVGIIYLTIMGFAGTLSYGDIVVVPDRELTASEQLGLEVFVERECAYCHNIDGKGGKNQGPDLANMKAKNRTREELAAFIKDPQAVDSWSVMPKYDLQQARLQGLADFILALDASTNPLKVVDSRQVLSESKQLANVQSSQ